MSDREHIAVLVAIVLLLAGCWAAWYARKSYEPEPKPKKVAKKVRSVEASS